MLQSTQEFSDSNLVNDEPFDQAFLDGIDQLLHHRSIQCFARLPFVSEVIMYR